MIKIKLTYPPAWDSISQQLPLNSIPNCRFFINEELKKCDYWFIVGELEKKNSAFCNKNNIFFLATESKNVKKYSKAFTNQFSAVLSCQQIKHPNLVNTLTTTFWHFKKEYDELNDLPIPKKTKLISIITSNKSFSSGHKKRLNFALKLKEHFGDKIDLYGRGINDFDDKWETLAPYKYSIAIENGFYDDWSTEKLSDCFLSYTIPFYYGCPNINKYYPEGSLIKIDINNFQESKRVIENIINNDDIYEERLKKLIEARKIYLEQYSIFNLISNIVKNDEHNPRENISNITIYPENKIVKKVNQLITRIKYI